MAQIAAQMFTLREFTKTPAELAKAYAKVARIGYKAVQASGHGPIDPEELKKVLDDNDLTLCSTHDKFGRFTDELDKLIADHQLWGCKYPAIGGIPGEMRTAEGYLSFARQFDGIGARLREAGMLFCYHNHDSEFAKFSGRTAMDIIMENSDPGHLSMEVDTFWVAAGGGDPAAWVARCGARGPMPLLHLKDLAIDPAKRERIFAEVGEGNLNWPAILAAARGAGVEWYIVEQDRCAGDPFDSLKKSYQNLREMGLE